MVQKLVHKPNVIKRALKSSNKTITVPLLGMLESLVLKDEQKPQFPPIFILGVPRSGSTIFNQIITHGLKVCYFSNFMHYFPLSPVIISRVSSHFGDCIPPKIFTNRYGLTKGWSAPHQGIQIWRRWFSEGMNYIGPNSIESHKLIQLRNTIAAIETTFNLPFVNKWQGHTVHIYPLVEAFPDALFIRIRRNPLQVAQSLLKSRYDLFGNPAAWTSTKPKEYEKIKNKHYIDQVCEQLYYLEENMDNDSNSVGIDRFLEIDYANLCGNTNAVLEKVRNFYRDSSGYTLKTRNPIPTFLDPSNSRKVGDEDFDALKQRVNQLFG